MTLRPLAICPNPEGHDAIGRPRHRWRTTASASSCWVTVTFTALMVAVRLDEVNEGAVRAALYGGARHHHNLAQRIDQELGY